MDEENEALDRDDFNAKSRPAQAPCTEPILSTRAKLAMLPKEGEFKAPVMRKLNRKERRARDRRNRGK